MRTDATLERAYVESKVIKASLERLAAHLDDADVPLRDDLRDCTDRFESYMRSMNKVYAKADARRS